MSNYRGPITRTHPLTGEPLRPLGIIAGRAVWPIMGGSSAAPEAPPAQPPAAPATPGQPGTTGTPPATPAPQPPAAPPQPPAAPAQPPVEPKAVEVGEVDTAANLLAKYTPEELAEYAVRLREEAKRGRTGAKKTAAEEARTELVQQLARDAGLLPPDGDGKVTPEQLTADLAAARDQARTAAVQLELYRTAAQHGAVAGDLLSLVVLRDTADLDPKAADFSAKVIAAAQAAVTANPVLKAAPAAARSGAEFTGGPGAPSTPTTLEEAIAAKMGG